MIFVTFSVSIKTFLLYSPAKQYDISLMKLKSPLKFDKYVQPISLPKYKSEPEGIAIAIGWGAIIAPNPDADDFDPILHKVTVPLIDRKTCQDEIQKLKPHKFVGEKSLCTSGRAGMSPCNVTYNFSFLV